MNICIYTANAAAVWSYSALRGSPCEVGLPSVRRWRWVTNLYSTAKDRIYHPLSVAVTVNRWHHTGVAMSGRRPTAVRWSCSNRGVMSQRGARKSVAQTINRDDGDDRDLCLYNLLKCIRVRLYRAVLAGRFRHQLGPFLYILWAVLVDTGRFGHWSGPFGRWAVFVHSLNCLQPVSAATFTNPFVRWVSSCFYLLSKVNSL